MNIDVHCSAVLVLGDGNGDGESAKMYRSSVQCMPHQLPHGLM